MPIVSCTQGHRLKRRSFAALLGSIILPATSLAQQTKQSTIGWLHPGSPEGSGERLTGLLKGMAAQGLAPGQNVAMEYRWGQGDYDRLPALAADLVARPVDVIVSGPITSTLAAKAATQTIPIVFTVGVDPAAFGLVASLGRPGGNLTGIAELTAELLPKRLQLLHELLPTAQRVGVLLNGKNPNAASNLASLRAAAPALGIELAVLSAEHEDEIERALETGTRQNIDALIIADDPYYSGLAGKLIALTARYRLPAIYYDRRFAEAGCLISYGPAVAAMYARAGNYVARILKGTKPADLPVVQPEQFQLVINLRTARTLGITVPASILARADEVIE